MEALILIKGMFDVCGMVHQSRLVAMASLTSERPENTSSSSLLFWAHCSPHWVIGWLSHWSQLDWTTRLEWRDWIDWGEEIMGLRRGLGWTGAKGWGDNKVVGVMRYSFCSAKPIQQWTQDTALWDPIGFRLSQQSWKLCMTLVQSN